MRTYNSNSIIPHPFELVFAENNPKFLVIGSFPTIDKKMSFNFFCPNANNKFWEVMSKIFSNSIVKLNLKVSVKDDAELKIQNEENRKQFCRENNIAMTDMLASCIRLDGNSKDEQLLVHRYNPIIEILKKHKTISTIIITAKNMGTSANHHFYQYLAMNEIDFSIDTKDDICIGEIEVERRKVNIFSLNSTSSRSSKAKLEKLIESYKKAFKQD